MDILYWALEYGKVFFAYLFLMFLWPSVVFRRHLRTRSKAYYFSFCVTVPIVIINTMVLLLGLFHVLFQETVCLIFYGIFVLALFKNIISYLDRRYKRLVDAKFYDVRTLKGKYRVLVLVILFFMECGRYIKKAARFLGFDYAKRIKTYNWSKFRRCNWSRFKVRIKIKGSIWDFIDRLKVLFWEHGMLVAVVIYGMIYFSYGAFQIYSYGYGDLYVHHEWVYNLTEGNIFSGGVYPEAMHCFIYCMHILFGIRIYSVLLFLQVIHVAVFLISAYLLLRKVFCWRYTPVFVLMLFLTLDLCNADLIHSMFRLQITMPMEFGLHTVCLSALYLMNYLKRDHENITDKKGRWRNYYWDENLFIFMLSAAAAVMVHFHVALMAAITCISFAVFSLKKIYNKKYLVPLVSAAFCAGVIAVTPMAGALAQGIPFNGSINWAIHAINGEESRELRGENEETDNVEGDIEGAEEEKELQDVKRNGINIIADIMGIYDKGYAALYGKVRGAVMLVLTIAAVVFCCFIRRENKFKYLCEPCSGYPPAILVSFIYVIVYMAPMIGLPDILPEGRFFAPGHMMMLAVMAMPLDILFIHLVRFFKELTLRILSLLTILGIYVLAVITGSFRGFLFYELSRYNAAVMVTESIIDSFSPYSYTIISPTDELYPVIQYGWHEELLAFIENCGKEEYSISSEYVFIYVEKKPLLYAQSHFFQGPSWMGEEKYLEPFWEMYSLKYTDSGASQSPDIIVSEVSKEEAEKELTDYYSAWLMYSRFNNRKILESKAYEWCQWFMRQYPFVMNVYYEDDDFVCYYFRQDYDRPPYNLGMDSE